MTTRVPVRSPPSRMVTWWSRTFSGGRRATRSARSWSSWPAPRDANVSLPIDARRRYSTRTACSRLRSSCQRRWSSSMRARRASRAVVPGRERAAVRPRGAALEGDDRWRRRRGAARSWLTRSTVFGHACSDGLQPLLAGHVEVVVGLVEQEHVGVGAQEHLEGEPLLLAARQRGQRPVARLGERLAHGDRAAGVPQHLGVPAAGVAPDGVGLGEGHAGALARVGVGGGLGLDESRGGGLQRGSARGRAAGRGRCAPRPASPTSWRMTRSRPSTWTLPASGAWSPAMMPEEGGLAGAVGPDEGDVLAVAHAEAHPWSSSTPPGVRHATPFTSITPTVDGRYRRQPLGRARFRRPQIRGLWLSGTYSVPGDHRPRGLRSGPCEPSCSA